MGKIIGYFYAERNDRQDGRYDVEERGKNYPQIY